jgi:hypothetical protein
LNADLDSFISPILGFDGHILIPAILISARNPGVESSEDPSAGSSFNALRTWDSKQKVPIDPSPLKKAKKASRKPLGGIKISGPMQKALASTPPSGTQKGIPILLSKRYTCLEYFLLSVIW